MIVIRMTVTPIPIRPLFLLLYFCKRPILSVSLGEVPAIGMVFVVIPIVIVLVVTVVDAVTVLIVSTVLFLTSVFLLSGCSSHCRWCGKGCSEKKGTEEISIVTVHVVSSRLEISLSETPPREEYVLIAPHGIFNTAHLLKSSPWD
jgi:hypothetical protein